MSVRVSEAPFCTYVTTNHWVADRTSTFVLHMTTKSSKIAHLTIWNELTGLSCASMLKTIARASNPIALFAQIYTHESAATLAQLTMVGFYYALIMFMHMVKNIYFWPSLVLEGRAICCEAWLNYRTELKTVKLFNFIICCFGCIIAHVLYITFCLTFLVLREYKNKLITHYDYLKVAVTCMPYYYKSRPAVKGFTCYWESFHPLSLPFSLIG
jgi:hypothetical protein